ncbi:predicted protein [Chaetoceros tenuissimus]|uniref:Uncharacterized protein n=1 Tax=Chaetoceros tenuissimus TaxID=426638 RepID=A0AAD3CDJ4_9STRA|nr:predicted protein [Chaetoceros tenuissimus]
MHIINRSNQSNKKRRFSNNYASTSNVILFDEDELCSKSFPEKQSLECDKLIIQYHASDRKLASSLSPTSESASHECRNMYTNIIEYNPCEDIYEPLDFEKDWSKDLIKTYGMHMRNVFSNLESNEDHLGSKKYKRR